MKVLNTQILTLFTLEINAFSIAASNQTEISISGQLKKGAVEILTSRQRIDSLEIGQLTKHGCWCSKLDQVTHPGNGGKPIDDLDRICKNWFKSRNCLKLYQGSCYGHQVPFYSLDMNTCILNDAQCAFDICRLDLYYAELVEDFIGNFGLDPEVVFNDNLTCQRDFTNKQQRKCIGEFPEYEIVPLGDTRSLDQEHSAPRVESPRPKFNDYESQIFSPGAYSYDEVVMATDETDLPATTTASTSTTYLAKAPKISLKGETNDAYLCNGKFINVMLIIDNFETSPDVMKRKLDFLQGVMSYLHIGETNVLGMPTNNVTISLMTYSDTPNVIVSFSTDITAILQAIENVSISSKRGNMAQALLQASALLRHHNTMLSRDSQNVAIVLTDNPADKDATLSSAKYLQNIARVIAIGHGDAVKSGTLRLVASTPKNGNALVANADRIFRLIDIIPRKICNSYRVL